MPWRFCRTLSSTAWSRASSPGPFTASTAASNLPGSSGVVPWRCLTSSPGHVSTLSSPSTLPVSGQLGETTGGGAGLLSRFPVAFRPPAFASWPSVPRWAINLPYGQLTSHVPTLVTGTQRDCHVPHDRESTGVGALSTPRQTVSPDRSPVLRSASAASQRHAFHPHLLLPSAGSTLRGINKGSLTFTRPVFPFTSSPRMGRGALGLDHLSSAPRSHPRRTSGWGQANRHRPKVSASASTEPPCLTHSNRATSCRTGISRSRAGLPGGWPARDASLCATHIVAPR